MSWTRVLGAASFFAFIGFASWLYWPIPKQFVPLYTRIPKHVPTAPPEVARAPKIAKPRARKVAPVIVKSEDPGPYFPVAQRVCDTEMAHLLADQVANSRGCLKEFSNVNGELQKALKRKEEEGIRIDLDNCIATDDQGEVTDLLSACSELSVATRLILRSGGSVPTDEDSQRRWRRLLGVGLCSVMKSLNYWMEFPQEMPSSDDMFSSVYFNPVSGRPERTPELEVFWGLVQRFALKSPESST